MRPPENDTPTLREMKQTGERDRGAGGDRKRYRVADRTMGRIPL